MVSLKFWTEASTKLLRSISLGLIVNFLPDILALCSSVSIRMRIRRFSSLMILMKLRRVEASLLMESSSSISQARLMVAMGVLISWVMLFMKSVFISSSLR